nr:MAG TPA: hypothetical protein [Caudoviricetes sp.]
MVGAPCCVPKRDTRPVPSPGNRGHYSLETHVVVEMGGIDT